MKITKLELQRLIKEQLNKLNESKCTVCGGGAYENDVDNVICIKCKKEEQKCTCVKKKKSLKEYSLDYFSVMVYNESGSSGWECWKSPTKEDAQKVANFLQKQSHAYGKITMKVREA